MDRHCVENFTYNIIMIFFPGFPAFSTISSKFLPFMIFLNTKQRNIISFLCILFYYRALHISIQLFSSKPSTWFLKVLNYFSCVCFIMKYNHILYTGQWSICAFYFESLSILKTNKYSSPGFSCLNSFYRKPPSELPYCCINTICYCHYFTLVIQ